MRAEGLGILLLSSFIFMSGPASAWTPQAASQQKATSAQKTSQDPPGDAKEAEPFPDVPRITAEEVQRLLKDTAKLVLVDTDDTMTYGEEHIKGAVNMTYDPTVDPQEREAILGALPGDKLIVIYCNCPHEEDAAPIVKELWQLGYDHDKVKALKGGLARWEELHYPLAGTSVDASTSKGN